MPVRDRLYELDALLRQRRRGVVRDQLAAEWGVSYKTIERDIQRLELDFGAPIERGTHPVSYRYTAGESFQLPGLWLNDAQVTALLTTQSLLASAEPGLLAEHFAPLQQRLSTLLEKRGFGGGELQTRIKIIKMAGRAPGPCFQTVAAATIERQQLNISYFSRSSQQHSTRRISPQRLTHYRDSWYLDAWCHKREALRSFALENIAAAESNGQTAVAVAEQQLDEELASSYGIFAGKAKQTAVLRFSADRATWVSKENWHPQQHGYWLEDGRYQLELPYHRHEELLMDILKHGDAVEVLAPASLRRAIQASLSSSLKQYFS